MEISEEKLKTLIADAVSSAIRSQNLDNGIYSCVGQEDMNMASKHREYYTLLNQDGTEEIIRLNGVDKSETDLKFQEICAQRSRAKSTGGSDMSFRTFVEREYKPNHMVPPFIAETTQGKYEYSLTRYIYPCFGDKAMSEITVNTIQQFRKKMAQAASYGYAKNLTSKSIDDMTGFLNKIFKVAEAMDVIATNPIKRALLKKVGETPGHFKPMDPETLDRCKREIPHIEDAKVRLYAALLFYNGAGMRPEEILGLQWQDVDLDSGYADITRAVTYAGKNRHVVIKNTKTKYSVRGVLLPKILVEIMKPMKAEKGFVIHGREPDEPIPYSSFQRLYRKMQDTLGIRGQYCNYDLRTTYATEMIEEGYSSAITAKMMGHKDSRMVETVYAQTRRRGIEQMRSRIEEKNAAYRHFLGTENSLQT